MAGPSWSHVGICIFLDWKRITNKENKGYDLGWGQTIAPSVWRDGVKVCKPISYPDSFCPWFPHRQSRSNELNSLPSLLSSMPLPHLSTAGHCYPADTHSWILWKERCWYDCVSGTGKSILCHRKNSWALNMHLLCMFRRKFLSLQACTKRQIGKRDGENVLWWWERCTPGVPCQYPTLPQCTHCLAEIRVLYFGHPLWKIYRHEQEEKRHTTRKNGKRELYLNCPHFFFLWLTDG